MKTLAESKVQKKKKTEKEKTKGRRLQLDLGYGSFTAIIEGVLPYVRLRKLDRQACLRSKAYVGKNAFNYAETSFLVKLLESRSQSDATSLMTQSIRLDLSSLDFQFLKDKDQTTERARRHQPRFVLSFNVLRTLFQSGKSANSMQAIACHGLFIGGNHKTPNSTSLLTRYTTQTISKAV